MIEDASGSTSDTLAARVAELEAALAKERARADAAQSRADEERTRADEAIAERDRLREGYRHLQLEVEVMRRRLVVAKAERVDTAQLELEFAAKLRELDRLAGLEPGSVADPDVGDSSDPSGSKKKRTSKPTGRRRLSELDVPEERVELTDPALEGSAQRVGTEDNYKLMWRRAGYVRLVVARVKYKIGAGDAATIATTEVPRELITRALAAPSLLAHIATDKFCDGLPLHRQEDRFTRLGARIDRGTMSRWLEELGGAVGATVVSAMRDDALAHAFCIATDATGVLVQPIPTADKQPRSCARGHYFVQIADRDHVLFEYTAKETSAAVGEMFRGFSGYIRPTPRASTTRCSGRRISVPHSTARPSPTSPSATRSAAGRTLAASSGMRRSRRIPWRARASCVSGGSSSSIARGGRSRPRRSRRSATHTCARTPTRSSRGSRSSSSACAVSAASCAPRSATRTGSRAR